MQTFSAKPWLVIHPDETRTADRRQLPIPDPGTGQPRLPPHFEPKLAEDADEHFLEVAQVAVQITAVGLQVENRVADELTRPVIGNVATAARLEEFDPPLFPLLGGEENVFRVRSATQCDDVRMLEEEQCVRDLTCAPPLNELRL